MNQELATIIREPTNARIIWFLREGARRYSAILKHLQQTDSGKMNYHLKKLATAGLLCKEGLQYKLTDEGLRIALYIDAAQMKETYPISVVLIVIHQRGKILLAKRNRDPCKNCWGLPGNEILLGESVISAAKKEVRTELHAETHNEKVFGVYPTIHRKSGNLLYHVHLFVVKASIKRMPLAGLAYGKISTYQFFTKKEVMKLLVIPANLKPILESFSATQHFAEQEVHE